LKTVIIFVILFVTNNSFKKILLTENVLHKVCGPLLWCVYWVFFKHGSPQSLFAFIVLKKVVRIFIFKSHTHTHTHKTTFGMTFLC